MSKGKTILYGGIAVVVAVVFIVIGFSEKQKRDKLAADGVTVDAQILSGSEEGGRRSKTRQFEVQYQTAQGQTFTENFKVNRSYFESHISGDYIDDTAPCKVRYLPSDPKTAIVVDGSVDNTIMMYLGMGGSVVGLGMVGWGIKRKD